MFVPLSSAAAARFVDTPADPLPLPLALPFACLLPCFASAFAFASAFSLALAPDCPADTEVLPEAAPPAPAPVCAEAPSESRPTIQTLLVVFDLLLVFKTKALKIAKWALRATLVFAM